MNALKQFKRNISAPAKNDIMSNLYLSICNYNSYRKTLDAQNAESFKFDTQVYEHDIQEIQNHHKKIAEKTWNFEQRHLTSNLLRELTFKNKEESLSFMNSLKEKIDELDHHPEWTLNDNTLTIKLTSHSNKNNVSPKDYELAAFISQKYEQGNSGLSNYQRVISNAAGALLIFGTVYTIYSIYNLYKTKRVTSRDFYFQKISHSGNKH
jgi:4a-hydroxytetrahydrobiopterin dehydratase